MEPIEAVSNAIPNENTEDNEEKQSDDDIQIVTLNDGKPKNPKSELDRPGTTVIHLSQQSDQDTDHTNNTGAQKRDKKNPKQLSEVPYNLKRLHNRTTIFDLLQATKLRDLFAVSYLFRYIVCAIIGAISFLILALLWKIVFRINTCCIEGEDRRLCEEYMPFAFGFMVAFKNGFLIFTPLLYVVLPTVGVVNKHRTRFIFVYSIIIFVLFTCYGFYGYDWSNYSYISSAVLSVLALIIFFYWGGYFATWVIFPLFCATLAAFAIMSLMREYVWSVLNSDPVIFGIVYPMYLTILQVITFKCMLWFRLPYKIRQFFANICPNCCCRTEQNGQTPVYYDNFDSFWSTNIKYIEKQKTESKQRSEQDNTQSLQVSNEQSQPIEDNTIETQNNNSNTDTKPIENEQVKADEKHDENNNTQVIPKTSSGHGTVSTHRYKSTELELTVEDVWSNDILFVAGGTVIVLMESMRVAAMVSLKDKPGALALNVFSNILLECAHRNNLYWEFISKCCLKKENPPLTRFYASVIGTRYQTEYIPYFVVAMMNLTEYGPTSACIINEHDDLGDTISLGFVDYWWMYILLFSSEILSDLFADFVKKRGRKRGWFGNEDGDPAREATYVKLKPWMMVCVFIGFFAISLLAYGIDYDAKTRGQ